MSTATITAIAYADPANSTIHTTWSHGETQTYPADWKGFFRGGTGTHINGEEVQYVDGTEMDPAISVLDAFVAGGGVVAPYVPSPETPFEE